ncbi:MAG TPA: hypothetical protein VGE07_08845 [Herpetosiphonaceae bacterium]
MYVLSRGRIALVALAVVLWTGFGFGYLLAYLRREGGTIGFMFAGFALLGWGLGSGALIRWCVAPRCRWLLAHGLPAAALVAEAELGNMRLSSADGRLTSMRALLKVQPADGAPYEVRVKGLVPEGGVLHAGRRVRVRCAPDNPRELVIVPPGPDGRREADPPA